MKQFKGTQKDWSEVGHNDNGIFIGGKDSLGAICHVYFKNNEVSAEEGRANARLIANAKKMYDTLKMIALSIHINGSSPMVNMDSHYPLINELLNDINNEQI